VLPLKRPCWRARNRPSWVGERSSAGPSPDGEVPPFRASDTPRAGKLMGQLPERCITASSDIRERSADRRVAFWDRGTRVILRSVCNATVGLVLICLNSADLHACPVSLQIENYSSFTILGVKFRQHGADSWDHTSISLYPNNKTTLSWSDAGSFESYDIEVVYSNAPDHPQSTTICDVCTVSQITILNNQINIRGNCNDDQR
jgi:hypothetical protein